MVDTLVNSSSQASRSDGEIIRWLLSTFARRLPLRPGALPLVMRGGAFLTGQREFQGARCMAGGDR